MQTDSNVSIFHHGCYKYKMRPEEVTYYENIAEEMVRVYKTGLKKIKQEYTC